MAPNLKGRLRGKGLFGEQDSELTHRMDPTVASIGIAPLPELPIPDYLLLRYERLIPVLLPYMCSHTYALHLFPFKARFTLSIVERMPAFLPLNMLEVASYAEKSFARDMASGEQSPNIHLLPPDTRIDHPPNSIHLSKCIPAEAKDMRFPPPRVLPCANAQPAKYQTCTNPGTMACSQCRLVSYCSKDCQRQHWAKHKRDCRNAMLSDSWAPVWEREGRHPSFIGEEDLSDEFSRRCEVEFSVGMSLWGNTPAIDIINLDLNEVQSERDFSLAFIASGDLRHVLSTVNGLPLTYPGQLSILVNDFNPLISCRNAVLLLILGTVEDEALAVDMAIHFWYSIFMPSEYKLRLSIILTSFLVKFHSKTPIPLGPKSTLSACLPPESLAEHLSHIISMSLSIGDIQQEYDRVRAAFSRRDFRDRMYVGLRPSHRVAFERYRLFGLVLPFGALNAHFNCANNSLFSPSGKWMQTDYADPLEGWDNAAILAAGKACGAQPEDIYGCLYFFLTQELRKFSQRIRQFKISFTVSAFDAGHDLPSVIRDGDLTEFGIAPSTRFDRICVSNILDDNYVGLRQVLLSWSPFLAQTPHAAIVGYFMNWFASQPGGSLKSAGEKVVKAVMKKLATQRMRKKATPESTTSAMNMFRTMVFAETGDADALYDSSVPFEKFLKKRGLDDILKKSKLKLRANHTIVPHRILAPLEGKPSDLPVFPDDDSWYYNTKMTASTWSERYVEFTRA